MHYEPLPGSFFLEAALLTKVMHCLLFFLIVHFIGLCVNVERCLRLGESVWFQV